MNEHDLKDLRTDVDRLQRLAFIAGGAGLLVWVLGLILSGASAERSYLIGYLYWLGLPIGCLGLLLINHLAFGTWGLLIRRPLEAGAATMPLMTLLFLPVALGVNAIYPWATADLSAHGPNATHSAPAAHAPAAKSVAEHAAPDAKADAAHAEDAAHADAAHAADAGHAAGGAHGHAAPAFESKMGRKAFWFQKPFFFGRAIFYFAVWNFLAWVLIRGSRVQDNTVDPAPSKRLSAMAGPGLIALVLTGTFAMFDWVMSLEPNWYSTIYGAMLLVGQGLQTLCLAVIVTTILHERGALEGIVTPSRLRDLGNLMLAFTMLWAYTSYSQFIIIWNGNLAEEVPWYLKRSDGGWQVIATVLIVFHFFVPFFLLLMKEVKTRTNLLRYVAVFLFFMHLVDIFWIVAPGLGYSKLSISVWDVPAIIGVGGIWLGAYFALLRNRPLVARNIPELDAMRNPAALGQPAHA